MNGLIYSTPFNAKTLKTTGLGIDSKFSTISDVVAVMGNDYKLLTKRMVVYGNNHDCVVFSDITFHNENKIHETIY